MHSAMPRKYQRVSVAAACGHHWAIDMRSEHLLLITTEHMPLFFLSKVVTHSNLKGELCLLFSAADLTSAVGPHCLLEMTCGDRWLCWTHSFVWLEILLLTLTKYAT